MNRQISLFRTRRSLTFLLIMVLGAVAFLSPTAAHAQLTFLNTWGVTYNEAAHMR